VTSIEHIQALIKQSSRKANLSLIALMVVFCLSVAMFFFADRISIRSNNIDSREYETSLEKRLVESSKKGAEIQSFINDTQKIKEGLSKEVAHAYDKAKYDLEEQHRIHAQALEELKLLRSARLNELSRSDSGINQIVSTAITRLGAVTLALFMMQILLSFFRYFIRLSSYYEGKLASISAMSEDARIEVLKGISPEQIVFGKEPQMPFDKIIDLVKLGR
jgi:hypothetical protein